MYRGTTPILILNIDGDFTWSDVSDLQVTLRNNMRAISYTKSNVTWDGENDRILIQMSQNDTLALSGDVEVQLRYQIKNGNAFASNIAKVKFDRIISSNIVGDDSVHTRIATTSVEADLSVQSNSGDVDITIDHGEVVEGDPKITDIKVNNVSQEISSEGAVNISVPTDISQLSGTTELKGRVTTAENDIDALETAMSGKASASDLSALSNRVGSVESGLASKANSADVYTKAESDAKYLTEHQELKTINDQSIVGSGNITIDGMTPEQVAKLAEVDDKANASDVYTKTEADGKFLTEHQELKTINGQEITGEGDITVEGMTDEQKAKLAEVDNKANTSDVYSKTASDARYLQEHQSIKTINNQDVVGTGNITIKEITQAQESKIAEIDSKASASDVTTLQGKVASLEQETSKLGDLTTLNTSEKSSLVGAINSLGVKNVRWAEGGYEELIIELNS